MNPEPARLVAPREFPDKPKPRDLGDPALDPPMTVRVEGGQDRAVRYSTSARRAIKTDAGDGECWFIVTGSRDVGGAGWYPYLTDDEVRTWPVVHALVNEAAYARHAAPAPTVEQAPERGDMDVEAFRG